MNDIGRKTASLQINPKVSRRNHGKYDFSVLCDVACKICNLHVSLRCLALPENDVSWHAKILLHMVFIV
jgi:hypothetical protein